MRLERVMRYDCHGCIVSIGWFCSMLYSIVFCLVLVGGEGGHRYPALHHARRAWLDRTWIKIEGKMI